MVDQTASSGSIGAGQQVPENSNSDFTVTAFIVRQIMAQLETMLPVQVQAVHPGSGSPPVAGTVDVQLLVSQLDGAGNAVQQGIVYGLPYFRMQGGAWAIICDPATNDFGFIIAASRDISNVAKTPGIANPGSLRKYSYSDGIYVGGCFNAVPAATLWLKSDGTWVLSDKPGNVLQGNSNGITATVANGGTFLVNGNIAATGTIIADKGASQVGLTTHIHAGNNTPPTPGV
jgi:hypothetical protein